MINLIEIPQRSDLKVSYIKEDEKLIITLDNTTETFDFTGLQDGVSDEIIAEKLPLNPILRAEKVGDTINVEVLRFYGFEEKELFESGHN